jgi:hypothetical protein
MPQLGLALCHGENVVLQVRRQVCRLTFLIVAGLSLSACETGEVFISPSLNIEIRDSRTNSPIEHARVTMWSSGVNEVRETGSSNEEGYVYLPRLKGRLRVAFPFVVDPIEPNTVVMIEATGYVTQEINSDTGSSYFDGTRSIKLVPSTGP